MESSMIFYVSNNLNVDRISLNNNNKMLDYNNASYSVLDNQDIVIEDVGFIKITNSINVKIYYKDSINIRVRDNLI